MTQPNRLSPDSEASQDVVIGKLQKPRGIRGEIFCRPLTDFVERFGELDSVTAILPGGRREALAIENARMYGKRLGIKFRGLNTPEAAAVYRSSVLVVPKEETFDLPEDTFYVFDIIGMQVETEDGRTVGPVKDVLTLPGNDVYVVDRDGEEVMIPAVKELVTIDGKTRKIVVQSMEGLV